MLSPKLTFTQRLFSTAEDRAVVAEIDKGLASVEEMLLESATFVDPIANAAGRYLLEAGGKRVRPMLTLITSLLGTGINPQVLTAAQIIEVTHLASLYHDDVMDESELRRGIPAAQLNWGNSTAILAGDLLFARASQLGAGLGERAITMHADTFMRLCLGQLHETVGPAEGADPIAHYVQVLADKTGSLIATAAEMGAMFGGADPAFFPAVAEYGEKVGVAFQLVDDVLDLSDSPETGKLAGTDLRAGVVTLPLLYLRQSAETDPAAADLAARVESIAEGAVDHDEADSIIAELRAHEVTARTQAEADRWSREAVEALSILPKGSVRKALERFAAEIVTRTN